MDDDFVIVEKPYEDYYNNNKAGLIRNRYIVLYYIIRYGCVPFYLPYYNYLNMSYNLYSYLYND